MSTDTELSEEIPEIDEIDLFHTMAPVLKKVLLSEIINRVQNENGTTTVKFRYKKKDIDVLIETLPLSKYRISQADESGMCVVTAYNLEKSFYIYQALNRDEPEFPPLLWELICPGTEIKNVEFVDLDE